MKKPLLALGLAAMLAFGIAGCSGDDGATGATGPTGPTGPAGPPGQDATRTVKISELTAEQWASLTINGQVTKVTVASPTTVEFKLADQNGIPIVGIGTNTSTSGGVTSYSNIRFELAKLVLGTAGSPDEWISYIVQDNAGAPARPTTDQNGKLTDNGNGTYSYTFARDIPKVKDQVAAATVPSTSNKADLGDLTFDASLQHRLVIQISGSNAGATLENAANVVYDFVPATGAAIPPGDLKKDLVDIKACNACHQKLALHGGGRVDVQYCTTCHTSQRAFGQPKVASANGAFPALTETKTVNATTGITSYSYSPNLYVGDGEVMGHFTTMVHKIHQGGSLVKTGYNYANVAFNNKAFSMLDNGQRMCTVCHDPALASKAEYAYSQPSNKACGACHDGTNFRTGLANGPNGKDHVGRAQADDSACILCHSTAQTKVDHRTVNLTKHNQAITDGLVSFTYLIDSATVDASNNLKIVFAIQQQTAPSTTKTFATLPLSSNFTGGPSFLLAYALPQDGITTPADYNNIGQSQAQPKSVSLANLVAGTAGTLVASTSKQGYYEATIPSANAFPAGAKMRSVGLQGYWTQKWGDPASTADDIARHAISMVKTVAGDTARRKLVDATKCASCHEWFEGHGGNRVIGIETGSAELICVQCHVPGLATSGRRIPDTGTNASGAPIGMLNYAWTDADKFILKEWGLMDSSGNFLKTTNIALDLPAVTNNFKEMIHGIHAGRDRVVPFQNARDRTTVKVLLDFRRMDFPGVLSNCQGCHSVASGFQAYNLVPSNALVSVFESRNDAYVATPTPAGAGASLATANAKDTVQTPFGSACASCHDSDLAKLHMRQNGSKLNVNRDEVGTVAESCRVCHGAGADFDAVKVHQ